MDRPNDKKFVIGSKAFFLCYEDFTPHDTDILIFQLLSDNPSYKKHCYVKLKGKCVNYWIQKSNDALIKEHLETKDGMLIGKFLVPEVIKYLNFTIEELKQLEPLLNILDKKHQYERIIYNAYIENNDFTLTDKQRLDAYKSYKESRNL